MRKINPTDRCVDLGRSQIYYLDIFFLSFLPLSGLVYGDSEIKRNPTTMKTSTTLILCRCDGSLKYNPEVFEGQGFDDVIAGMI